MTTENNDVPWKSAKPGDDTDEHHASLYRDNPVTEFLATPAGNDRTRRERVLNSLYLTAIERNNPRQLRAAELLLAYDLGKPIETVNVGGHVDHQHHNADPVAEGLQRMIAEKNAAEVEAEKPS